jgi:hypothetical protein
VSSLQFFQSDLSKIVRVMLEGVEHSFSVDSQLPPCFEEDGTLSFPPEQVGVIQQAADSTGGGNLGFGMDTLHGQLDLFCQSLNLCLRPCVFVAVELVSNLSA